MILLSTILFISSLLLFSLELQVGKMILPIFGGSPASWNTCMFFYQAVLLGAYVFAHVISLCRSYFSIVVLYVVLAALALLFLPVSIEPVSFVRADIFSVSTNLLLLLIQSIGIPIFLLALSAPLFQYLCSQDVKVLNPYLLYAASNIGSAAGLLAYPFLIERLLPVSTQSYVWMYIFIFMLVLVCVYFSLHRNIIINVVTPSHVTVTSKLRWLLYSFLPSSLLLGITYYITQNVTAIPLFWMIPLLMYLLSFVLVFANRGIEFVFSNQRIFCFALLLIVVAAALEVTAPVYLIGILHMAAFFYACMYCHGKLYIDKPAPENLTVFYVYLALGGALGGFFNTFLAPLVFNGVNEYILMLIAVLFLFDVRYSFQDFLRAFVCLSIAFFYVFLVSVLPIVFLYKVLGIAIPFVILVYMQVERKNVYALIICGLFFVLLQTEGLLGREVFSERNFYGTTRVTLSSDRRFYQLVHGDTVHGVAMVDKNDTCIPRAYYYPTSPVGHFFETWERENAHVAVIGLGVGSLACYAKPDEQWTFFEINPSMFKLANRAQYFTYLENASAGKLNHIIGDARLTMSEVFPHTYSLLVLDAFSSDSIPLHLLTREAFKMYVEKNVAGAPILIHMSNRFFNLAPALASMADELGRRFYVNVDTALSEEERLAGKSPSVWGLFLSKDSSQFNLDDSWRVVDERTSAVWTDDYSSVLELLM